MATRTSPVGFPVGGLRSDTRGWAAPSEPIASTPAWSVWLIVFPCRKWSNETPAVPLLIVREASGTHGQEMIDAGRTAEVLRLLGSILVTLQQVPPWAVPGLVGTGPVIVHGDFGPQNVLIEGDRINALVDWEFAHIGQPVEDLAWAEWIVRMHHPDAVDVLPELLDASRLGIEWSGRHQAMVARCEELIGLSTAAGSPDTVELWRDWLRATELWNE
jgi:hypothetical protein